MDKYELTLVLTQEAGATTAKANKQASILLAKVDAKLLDTNVIGLRDLAYPILKQDKGWYGVFFIEMDPSKVADLDKEVRLDEKVLRHLLVKSIPLKAKGKKSKTSKPKADKGE